MTAARVQAEVKDALECGFNWNRITQYFTRIIPESPYVAGVKVQVGPPLHSLHPSYEYVTDMHACYFAACITAPAIGMWAGGTAGIPPPAVSC